VAIHIHSQFAKSYTGERPTKRRRLDTGFLHNIVPRPHYHQAPSADYSLSNVRLLSAYVKSQPIPIPTYDLSKIQAYLNEPYSRSAWIIPIRGILPWRGSTSAMILKDSETIPPNGPSPISSVTVQESCITWTHSAIASFWDFLLAVQKAKTLGPISVSFHAAPTYASPILSMSTSTEPDINHVLWGENVTSKSSDGDAVPTSLMTVDHVKIYHEVTYAMYLRNVLDAWGYHYQSLHNSSPQIASDEIDANRVEREDDVTGRMKQTAAPQLANAKSKKIRILKGALLVLVDDSLNGMLLS